MQLNKQTFVSVATTILAAGAFLVPLSAGAQPAVQPLASVTNLHIIAQDSQTLQIALDVSVGEGSTQQDLQVGLKAFVQGSKTADTALVESTVDDSLFTVSANKIVHRDIAYAISDLPDGDYYVLPVVYRNGNIIAVGKQVPFTVTGSEKSLLILRDTCMLFTKDGYAHSLGENVPVEAGQPPLLSCSVRNMSKLAVSAFPVFWAQEATFNGRNLAVVQQDLQYVNWNPGEQKAVLLNTPPIGESKQYDTYALTVHFSGQKGTSVSGPIRLLYGIKGGEVSVAQAVFDKSSYMKGDTIRVSGNVHVDGETPPEGTFAVTAVVHSAGEICASSSSTPLKVSRLSSRFSLTVTAQSDCQNPEGAVLITGNGRVTASAPISLTAGWRSDSSFTGRILLAAGVVAVLLLVVFRKRMIIKEKI